MGRGVVRLSAVLRLGDQLHCHVAGLDALIRGIPARGPCDRLDPVGRGEERKDSSWLGYGNPLPLALTTVQPTAG